jgi:hypothetical protein
MRRLISVFSVLVSAGFLSVFVLPWRYDVRITVDRNDEIIVTGYEARSIRPLYWPPHVRYERHTNNVVFKEEGEAALVDWQRYLMWWAMFIIALLFIRRVSRGRRLRITVAVLVAVIIIDQAFVRYVRPRLEYSASLRPPAA